MHVHWARHVGIFGLHVYITHCHRELESEPPPNLALGSHSPRAWCAAIHLNQSFDHSRSSRAVSPLVIDGEPFRVRDTLTGGLQADRRTGHPILHTAANPHRPATQPPQPHQPHANT